MSAVTARHHSPLSDASRLEAPRAEPIEIEQALVQADEHDHEDRDIRGGPRQCAADLLDAALPDRAPVLVDVLRELAARLGRVRGRNPELPACPARQTLMLDAERGQHEAELRGTLLVRDGRDRNPRLCLILHLC